MGREGRHRRRREGSGWEGPEAHRDPLTLVRPELEAEEWVEHHVHLALAAQRHAGRHPGGGGEAGAQGMGHEAWIEFRTWA